MAVLAIAFISSGTSASRIQKFESFNAPFTRLPFCGFFQIHYWGELGAKKGATDVGYAEAIWAARRQALDSPVITS
jgi:hypothetical protein